MFDKMSTQTLDEMLVPSLISAEYLRVKWQLQRTCMSIGIYTLDSYANLAPSIVSTYPKQSVVQYTTGFNVSYVLQSFSSHATDI